MYRERERERERKREREREREKKEEKKTKTKRYIREERRYDRNRCIENTDCKIRCTLTSSTNKQGLNGRRRSVCILFLLTASRLEQISSAARQSPNRGKRRRQVSRYDTGEVTKATPSLSFALKARLAPPLSIFANLPNENESERTSERKRRTTASAASGIGTSNRWFAGHKSSLIALARPCETR